ncbi:MAG: hypothetical protein RhofKO_02500 [Rhodothermales bacterium]
MFYTAPAYAQRPFITTWTVDEGSLQLVVPTHRQVETRYDFTVDWGDGVVEHYSGIDPDPTHTYAQSGTYTVTVSGTFLGIHFQRAPNWLRRHLIDINQWGDMRWENMAGAFYGASELRTLSATDTPDLSRVTDMSFMFARASRFNHPIGDWDVSSVVDMSSMFDAAGSFNQPLDSWDVSNVTGMEHMFRSALSFNQPLANWNVAQVTTMEAMFDRAEVFNQPLSGWNVGRVTDMGYMFSGAQRFNQALASWDVHAVLDMESMFSGAAAFNQPLAAWNVGAVTTMLNMFSGAVAFNQPLAAWNVSNVARFDHFLTGTQLDGDYYDDLLIAWANLPLQPAVPHVSCRPSHLQRGRSFGAPVHPRSFWVEAPRRWDEHLRFARGVRDGLAHMA